MKKTEEPIQFNGKGPFSSINTFTTKIQMIRACSLLGIPYEHDEFAEGVLNAERIISEQLDEEKI